MNLKLKILIYYFCITKIELFDELFSVRAATLTSITSVDEMHEVIKRHQWEIDEMNARWPTWKTVSQSTDNTFNNPVISARRGYIDQSSWRYNNIVFYALISCYCWRVRVEGHVSVYIIMYVYTSWGYCILSYYKTYELLNQVILVIEKKIW